MLWRVAEDARKAATAAQQQAASASARNRLLLRELNSARSQLKAQQARMMKRSSAQAEVVQMQAQLQRAHDAQVAQQHQIKQLQLRERLRAERGETSDEGVVAAADSHLATLARIGTENIILHQVRPHITDEHHISLVRTSSLMNTIIHQTRPSSLMSLILHQMRPSLLMKTSLHQVRPPAEGKPKRKLKGGQKGSQKKRETGRAERWFLGWVATSFSLL